MTPHWSIYIIIRMSEGSRKLWKGHGVSGIKITESGKLGKPKTLGSSANFAQFLQPYAYVWSCVLVGLSGMYTQIEFRLVIMKYKCQLLHGLKNLSVIQIISRRGNENRLLSLAHVFAEECSPCCFSKRLCLVLGVCYFPVFSPCTSRPRIKIPAMVSAKCRLNFLSERRK